MSDNTSTTSTTNNKGNPSKSPTHTAYHVREGKNGKGFWTRIGAAWPNADGQGFNIQLDCVPLDGRVTIRVASDNREQQ